MANRPSTLSILIEAKDKSLEVLKRLQDRVRGVRRETEGLSAAQARAAEGSVAGAGS